MNTIELKKSILKYIDNADDRLLKMIKELVENYHESDEAHQIPVSHKEILEDRLRKYKENSNNLPDWEEVKDSW